MSQKDALAFISKVSEDAALQQQVSADPARWDQVAKAAGFDVTIDELNAASVSIHGKWKDETGLTDEQLAQVTGGAGLHPQGSTYPTYVKYDQFNYNIKNLCKLDAFKVAAW